MSTHYDGTPAQRRALDLEIKLFRANNTLRTHLYRFLDDYGLTESQFATLEAIYHLGPLPHRKIAEKILKQAGNITLVVDNLEKDNLVERRRSSEDRRVVEVHLTEQGKKLIQEVMPRYVTFLTEEISVLDPEEQAQLARLCKKLGLALEKST